MADGSLMDFGDIARTSIGLGHLLEQQRHNDLLEHNSLLDVQKVQVQKDHVQIARDKMKQDSAFKAMDVVQDMEKNPAFAMNPQWQAQAQYTKAFLLKNALGVETIPMPDPNEILGSLRQTSDMLKSFRSDDPDMRRSAFEQLTVAAPGFATRILDEMKKANELDAQGEDLRTKLQIHKATLSKLNAQAGRYTLQQGLYTEHVGAIGQTASLPDSPEFKDHFYKLVNMKTPEAQQTYLNLNPEFKRDWEKRINERSLPLGITLMQINDEAKGRERAMRDAQAKNGGQAPQELAEEVTGYLGVQRARQIEQAWLDDPFNKEKWEGLKKAQQDLRILQQATTKKIDGVERDRLNILQQKMDETRNSKLATDYLQEKFVGYVGQGGYNDNQALSLAIRDTKAQYPNTPFDVGAAKNMEKAGKLSVDVNTPTGAVRSEIQKNLMGLQSTRNVITNLKNTIEQNNIGLAGALKSTAYGFTSQVKGLAEVVGAEAVAAHHKDFTPSRWFDPKASTVDLLANTLAYRLINLEQGGRVSDKDLAEMKQRLNINSWMAGKEDALQRLTELEKQLNFEESVYRRVMPTFGKEGAPTGGQITTAEDYLKSIGYGAEQ